MFKIIKYSQEYRDDMWFCFLYARDAAGMAVRLRDDLFDIQSNYFDKGDMFWIAVDCNNRVVGMVGTNATSETDMWLKRLFIKPEMKRKGIATALLNTAVEYAKQKGIALIHTRFADIQAEAVYFYPAMGFVEDEPVDEHTKHFVKRI